jgi:hypothetical protein
MMRYLFLREEEDNGLLILCSGIPESWLSSGRKLSLGPTLTAFGPVSVAVQKSSEKIRVSWEGKWRRDEPKIEIRLCGHPVFSPQRGQTFIEIEPGRSA